MEGEDQYGLPFLFFFIYFRWYMFAGIQAEALSQGCASCSAPFKDRHRAMAIYRTSEVTSFYHQVELGIIGAQVRNYWRHLDCIDPTLKKASWHMNPDLHHCIRCNQGLDKRDMVTPVFQVIDPKAINPLDATDVGVALAERVYFVHSECKNVGMNKNNTNLLYKG